MRNPVADTPSKIQELVDGMKQDILRKKLALGHVLRINDVPIMFTHAGFHSGFLSYLERTIGSMTPEDITSYLNGILIDTTISCVNDGVCEYDDQIFEAGRDRGGSGIGGPL